MKPMPSSRAAERSHVPSPNSTAGDAELLDCTVDDRRTRHQTIAREDIKFRERRRVELQICGIGPGASDDRDRPPGGAYGCEKFRSACHSSHARTKRSVSISFDTVSVPL